MSWSSSPSASSVPYDERQPLAVELVERREPPVRRLLAEHGEDLGVRLLDQPGIEVHHRADDLAGRLVLGEVAPRHQSFGPGAREAWPRGGADHDRQARERGTRGDQRRPAVVAVVSGPPRGPLLVGRPVQRARTAAPTRRTAPRRRTGCPARRAAAENTNRVVAGSRASNVAHSRNAAQSATNTMAQTAATLAARNPLCTGAGARTSPNGPPGAARRRRRPRRACRRSAGASGWSPGTGSRR